MLDDTMGPAVLLKSGGVRYPSTIDMNLTFFAAAKPGPLICEGEVTQLGKTVGFLEGRLTDPDGRLLVRATATARVIDRDRATG
jgi:acyl-coenzyme A thioesterase PaaI-like protein